MAIKIGDEVVVVDTAAGKDRQAFVREISGFRLRVYLPRYNSTFDLWEGRSNRGRFILKEEPAA